jgi:undecaprenyl-diphosphatase
MINVLLTIDKVILSIFSRINTIVVLDQVMLFFTIIGETGAVWIIISIIFLVKKEYRFAGCIVTLALLFSLFLVNLGLKPAVQRPRPFIDHKEIVLKIEEPSEYSFPSGHTSSSFAAACAIVLVLRKKGLSLSVLSLAVIISFTRIYFNVHYVSDIIVGMLCGILCACGAYAAGRGCIKLMPESVRLRVFPVLPEQ